MSETPDTTFNLNLTDDEFLALHAAASAKGLQVNDFIVATLRQHTLTVLDIESEHREKAATSDVKPIIPSPS